MNKATFQRLVKFCIAEAITEGRTDQLDAARKYLARRKELAAATHGPETAARHSDTAAEFLRKHGGGSSAAALRHQIEKDRRGTVSQMKSRQAALNEKDNIVIQSPEKVKIKIKSAETQKEMVDKTPISRDWKDTYGNKIPDTEISENDVVKEEGRRYQTDYVVSGLEQIPPSIHTSKPEALKAAAEFIRSYNTPGSKQAGEVFTKIENGYALKHVGGGTVAIATVTPITLHHGGLNEVGDIKPGKISNSERNKIGMAFKKVGVDGNGRFPKVEAGLSAITDALSTLGFQLDMVTKDIILGDKGSRMLTYRRVNDPGQDPFTEKPEIQNSRIVFSWERMDGPSGQYPDAPHKFEILAYAS